MTQYYKNALISTLLKDQMCYIECSMKKSWKSDITEFEPENGKFCRARCWQDWGDGEGDLKVYGLNEISYDADTWGIEIQAFLKASYDNYKTNGFRYVPELPSTDQLFNGEMTPTTGSYLPVCDSYLGLPKRDPHSGIPCMCGDEYGSETTQFWTAANFDSWAATKVEGQWQTEKGPPYLCKSDMSIAQTPPVAYFINMCNLGWRWPTVTDDNDLLMKGPDSHCEEFKYEARVIKDGFNMDFNCHIRFGSSLGKEIQSGSERQRKIIENLYWTDHYGFNGASGSQDYNFHRACQVWEENNGQCSGEKAA